MFCNKCGNKVEERQVFCSKCGNRLVDINEFKFNEIKNQVNNAHNNMMYNQPNNIPNNNVANSPVNNMPNNNMAYKPVNNIPNNNMGNRPVNNMPNNNMKVPKNKGGKKNTVIPITVTALLVVLMVGYFIFYVLTDNGDFYFSNNGNGDVQGTLVSQSQQKKGKYATAIITDNVYTGISVKNDNDAINLIKKDSVDQKKSDYPKEIIEIENRIINNYSISAVNLKEMDVDFAKELENVIKKIYDEYPKARGHLTNLTLTNLNMSQNSIVALFMPIFQFGTSDTNTTRPWVIKTQVQLNASYFLNPSRIESTVQASSKVGHFPKNATKYSPVAHEFGHYLSFIALLNHYKTDSILIVKDNDLQNFYNIYNDFAKGKFSKQMLDEAYKDYQKDGGTLKFDEWRGGISQYALAKDEAGQYIYDESIAEAFHDVYLNGNNANSASKYIVKVLKKYVGG